MPGTRSSQPSAVHSLRTQLSLGSHCPALVTVQAWAWTPGPEADLSGVALQWGSFSAPAHGLLPDPVVPQDGHADPIHACPASLWPSPDASPRGLCVGHHVSKHLEGPWEPLPRPRVSRQHPSPGGPRRGAGQEVLPLPGRSAGAGRRGLERSRALPEPLTPSRRGGPTSSRGTDEETEAQGTEVSCPGHVAGRPPARHPFPALRSMG